MPEDYREIIEWRAREVVALTGPEMPLPPAMPPPADVVPYDACAYCRWRMCERNPQHGESPVIHFSDPMDKIVAALFVCDDNLGDLKKNATNPHFKSKYADLGATCDAIQPGLTAAKLLVIQAPLTAPDGAVGVETMVLHASGQWVRPDPLFLPLGKADPQGAGSAITYARRYALAAFFNLAPEDDDANGAMRPKAPQRPLAAPPGRGVDPNSLLVRAVALGLIPASDKILFKEWARTKVPGCKLIEDSQALSPAHLSAITKYLDEAEDAGL